MRVVFAFRNRCEMDMLLFEVARKLLLGLAEAKVEKFEASSLSLTVSEENIEVCEEILGKEWVRLYAWTEFPSSENVGIFAIRFRGQGSIPTSVGSVLRETTGYDVQAISPRMITVRCRPNVAGQLAGLLSVASQAPWLIMPIGEGSLVDIAKAFRSLDLLI